MPQKLNKPRVLGVLAGKDLPADRLIAWVYSADIILAADGAADTLDSCQILPDTTIGDLDSISISTKARQVELIHIDDQDTSDCDKLLILAVERGYADITLIGVEGDQLDHVLGNLYSAARSPLSVRLVLRRGIAHLLRGPVVMSLDLPDATRLSLLPLSPCSGVTLEGVAWPLAQANLSPIGLVSLSNRSTGRVDLELAVGTAILLLSHPDLEVPAWD
jgi:thiamine pyrophosphokinase